jgi:hypothetical protein
MSAIFIKMEEQKWEKNLASWAALTDFSTVIENGHVVFSLSFSVNSQSPNLLTYAVTCPYQYNLQREIITVRSLQQTPRSGYFSWSEQKR